jgi:muconolactone delta-isomerase
LPGVVALSGNPRPHSRTLGAAEAAAGHIAALVDGATPVTTIDLAAFAAEILAAEQVRGRELIAGGVLKRIWRIPGRFSNYSLYDVQNATVLHDLLSSLPLWPWTNMQVEPLAIHPLEAPVEP